MSKDLERNDFVFQQIGNLLSSSHELSQNILRRLSYKDLVSALKVCQIWFNVGKSILEKERRFEYAVFHPQGFPTTEAKATLTYLPDEKLAFECFVEQTNFENVDCCLAFSNGEWLFRKDILNCADNKVSTLSSVLTKVIPSSCHLGLVCASGVVGTSECSQQVSFAGTPNLSCSINSCLTDSENEEDIGANSNLSSHIDTPVVGSSLSHLVGCSIEIEEDMMFNRKACAAVGSDAISLILFPKQPGVKLNVSYIDKEAFYKKLRPDSFPHKKIVISQDEFNSVCNLNPTDDLKALLLFYCDQNSFIESFTEAALLRQNENLALGGGLVRAVQQKGDILNGLVAISFSGTNVKAFSIVIPPNVKTAESLENHLIKLQEHYTPDTQNIGFLFACCGRGRLWYQRNRVDSTLQFYNVESKAFRKLFPSVPLFGFFGEGEVGVNHLPTDSGTEAPKKKRKKRAFHQFTSIFVLISIQ